MWLVCVKTFIVSLGTERGMLISIRLYVLISLFARYVLSIVVVNRAADWIGLDRTRFVDKYALSVVYL